MGEAPPGQPLEVAQFVLVRTEAGWRAAVRCGLAADGGALVAFAEDLAKQVPAAACELITGFDDARWRDGVLP